MGEYTKIKIYEHAEQKLFEGTLSIKDFETIVDECSNDPLDIICQKIKQMGKTAIENFKLKKERKEKGLNPISFVNFNEFEGENVLD